MTFWCAEVTACMEWLDNRGFQSGPMSPVQFAETMDAETGVRHEPHDDPKVCATRWLDAINAGAGQ